MPPVFGHADGEGDGAGGGDLRRARARVLVFERGEALAIPEWVEGLAVEVAVSAAAHRVVAEGGQLIDGLVEGDGQAARGAEAASEQARDGGAAFSARVPGLYNRWQVAIRPVDGHGAAAHQHEHDGLAERGHTLQQPLLRGGQVEARSVAAFEAGRREAQLFTLDAGREPRHHDDEICLARSGDGVASRVAPVTAQDAV